ncbi:taste receptor type 1 member 3 [Sceloporus undulatus]|uniref:taste receptor type 1 member 3 n=1 Tax=Sceloporus undulatus TaxID=8520 RepID=UPI001C4B91F9|nr:taste receptor type 1 member 3 [Sceloporus undulatus]
MKFAVEEINNSTTLLPGIELGYELFDSCMEPMVVLQPSLLFLSKMHTSRIRVSCNYTNYQTQVVAVIGPHNSELCMVTAKLFSFFLIPQVSYGATSEKLNNAELYPSFFRTVPSDKIQIEAISELLLAFQWNWVAIVASDDEYGREGLSLLSSIVINQSICIAYEGLIPADMSHANLQEKMTQTIHSINETNVNVIILFSKDRPVREFFKMWFKLGLNKKVWLATEAWVMSDVVISLDRVKDIGTVIGFVIKAGTVPEFEDYVSNLLELTQQDAFCQASREQAKQLGPDVLGPQCQQCSNISRDKVTEVLQHRQTFAVYTAVYGVAHALHKTLRCQRGQCQKLGVKPWQLLEKLNGIHFSIHNQSFHFDEHHSINMGYEVMWWSWPNKRIKHVSIGDFHGKLSIDKSKVHFHTGDQKAPLSECRTTCSPGQIRRMKGFHLCCYDCIDCESGTFYSSSGDSTCTPCPEHQWSPQRSTRCYDRSEKYIFWSDPMAICLLGLLLVILALICLSGVLFLKNIQTPVVQAAGGGQGPLGLFGLAMMCVSTILYIGKPTPIICQMQQPSFALCLNLCFSTISAKALQIMLAHDFADSRPNCLHAFIRRRSWAFVAGSFLVELSLCLVYFYGTPSVLIKNYKLLPTEVLLQCQVQYWGNFAIIHGQNSILAFISFLSTFMVQSSPKKYNIARSITFAMITYFISLIIFIPVYATVKQVTQPAIQISAMLQCTLGILASYYLPKCYILQFKPEWNTQDYFQDYTQEKDTQN